MKKSLISLTFDDGWMSQYENAIPILDKYGYKGTFYIITKYLYKKHPLYMFADNIVALHEDNHEIGSHSATHPSLPYYFWKDTGFEIRDSKNALEELLDGSAIKSFAYPYGRYNTKIKKMVEATGYENARGVSNQLSHKGFNGFNWSLTSPFELCCKSVKRDTTASEVRIWIEIAKKEKFWLILNFHQISGSRFAEGCTPEMLSLVCQLIDNHQIEVTPVSKAKDLYFQKELVH